MSFSSLHDLCCCFEFYVNTSGDIGLIVYLLISVVALHINARIGSDVCICF